MNISQVGRSRKEYSIEMLVVLIGIGIPIITVAKADRFDLIVKQKVLMQICIAVNL
jgi:hypothetical protein